MKKTKSKAKGSVKRRSYSADERFLYRYGQLDSGYPYNLRSLGRITRLKKMVNSLHPSYKAGLAHGEKMLKKAELDHDRYLSESANPRFVRKTARRVASKKEPKIGKELASFLEDVWSNPYDK